MKIPKHNTSLIHSIVLIGGFLITLIYAFVLAYKRFTNFEYGKFDLGNMSQMVWNTSRGDFMMVTDQFGTNMPRWGMSHVDPILALFAPFYWFFAHPMLIVFFQHAMILSVIFPLFWLTQKFTRKALFGYVIVFAYILYPANGFSLVWTGFHGISFVAPLFIWLVWFLEEHKFLKDDFWNRKNLIIYWALIILMLMGKEEIGFILFLFSIFLYFKNTKLAIHTAIVTLAWSLICFVIIIPAYAELRQESINTFIEQTRAEDLNPDAAGGDNFFFSRYSYLGDNYKEMLVTTVTKPSVVSEVAFSEDKLESINYLIGPLGYLFVVVPLWLISLPDIAIVLLSKDAIFDISNHRIAFVVVSLFVSLVYFYKLVPQFLEKKVYKNHKKKNTISYVLLLVYSASIIGLTLYYNNESKNPLYVSGVGFVKDGLLSKVFAKEDTDFTYTIGQTREGNIPRNNDECLHDMAEYIKSENPHIYTGPDYLGAHSALRWVNALFPARFWDADMVIADVFETKAVGPLESTSWLFNKKALQEMSTRRDMDHVYSCGKMSLFVPGFERDQTKYLGTIETPIPVYQLKTERLVVDIGVVSIPEVYSEESTMPIEIVLRRMRGGFYDKTGYFKLENKDNPDNTFTFTDYLSYGRTESLASAEDEQWVYEKYHLKLPKRLDAGEYRVFYGTGDLLDATEVYMGDVAVDTSE